MSRFVAVVFKEELLDLIEDGVVGVIAQLSRLVLILTTAELDKRVRMPFKVGRRKTVTLVNCSSHFVQVSTQRELGGPLGILSNIEHSVIRNVMKVEPH